MLAGFRHPGIQAGRSLTTPSGPVLPCFDLDCRAEVSSKHRIQCRSQPPPNRSQPLWAPFPTLQAQETLRICDAPPAATAAITAQVFASCPIKVLLTTLQYTLADHPHSSLFLFSLTFAPSLALRICHLQNVGRVPINASVWRKL